MAQAPLLLAATPAAASAQCRGSGGCIAGGGIGRASGGESIWRSEEPPGAASSLPTKSPCSHPTALPTPALPPTSVATRVNASSTLLPSSAEVSRNSRPSRLAAAQRHGGVSRVLYAKGSRASGERNAAVARGAAAQLSRSVWPSPMSCPSCTLTSRWSCRSVLLPTCRRGCPGQTGGWWLRQAYCSQ